MWHGNNWSLSFKGLKFWWSLDRCVCLVFYCWNGWWSMNVMESLDTGWVKCFGMRKMAKFHFVEWCLYDIWRKYAMAVQIWVILSTVLCCRKHFVYNWSKHETHFKITVYNPNTADKFQVASSQELGGLKWDNF